MLTGNPLQIHRLPTGYPQVVVKKQPQGPPNTV